MTAGRTPCCVPGCRRSFRSESCEDGVNYICGRCFRLADARFTRRYRQLRARLRTIKRLTSRKTLDKIFAQAQARGRHRCVSHHIHDRQMSAAFDRCWDQIVADAEIKLAMGADGAPRRQLQNQREMRP